MQVLGWAVSRDKTRACTVDSLLHPDPEGTNPKHQRSGLPAQAQAPHQKLFHFDLPRRAGLEAV